MYARAYRIPIGLLAVAGFAVFFGRMVLAVVLVGIALLLIGLLAAEQFQRRKRRPTGPGFRYVLIEQDGAARELTVKEQVYVETPFEFGDGAAPYFKPWYAHRNPRGDLGGFLRRDQLPRDVVIQPAGSPAATR